MFLSAQPLLHLTASSFTMDMVEEPEQPAHTNEPEEEQSIHNVYIYIAPAQKWLVFTTCDSKINCIMYVFVLAAT